MKLGKRSIFEIIIVIFAVGGFIFSFYNVMSDEIQKSENRFAVMESTDEMLKYQKNSKALECNSTVYLEMEEERIQDPSKTVHIIHDFEHDRIYTEQNKGEEIMEYSEDSVSVYTRGVMNIYSKDNKKIENVSQNEWYYYDCEKIYGMNKKNAHTDLLSYGYLEETDDIIGVADAGIEVYGDIEYTKYIVTIKNTLRDDLTQDMGDTGLRKLLSSKGLNSMVIRKEYPEVYTLLKDIYNRETEELLVWLDGEGEMTWIEKDYTFTYYTDVMKENSDLIENKVGKYNYPKVTAVQSYRYSPESSVIQLPQVFYRL